MKNIENLHFVNLEGEKLAVNLGAWVREIYQVDCKKSRAFRSMIWGDQLQYHYTPGENYSGPRLYAYPSQDMKYLFISHWLPGGEVLSIILDAEGNKVADIEPPVRTSTGLGSRYGSVPNRPNYLDRPVQFGWSEDPTLMMIGYYVWENDELVEYRRYHIEERRFDDVVEKLLSYS
ncbi:hypothetical protein SIN8267_01148 [Sinobacterium norvegicum]|uniref:Uncharacterized protein n=1 Tax=Sinobacterium norvegicum TaxID=1641715 RepID=A0ABM9ACY3_9GAMM|nr:hypothetical protein [Sinobacterium norvegicum]CAH0991047.1 hypothetical protein SIN8267_01148 [Sinobacterium norvegicum]